MWYLFLQMYGWIFLAFVFGWLSHWFLYSRTREEQDPAQSVTSEPIESTVTVVPLTVVEATQAAVDENWKPEGLPARPENADELKRIKGIGAVLEETLNQLGIYQFTQIAEWNERNILWLEKFLAYPGRINREEWQSQAKILSQEVKTDFEIRVDADDVDYS